MRSNSLDRKILLEGNLVGFDWQRTEEDCERLCPACMEVFMDLFDSIIKIDSVREQY